MTRKKSESAGSLNRYFNLRSLRCPKCGFLDVDTPFFYPPSTFEYLVPGVNEGDIELGILAYKSGEASNRWEDGTAGVPERIKEAINLSDDLPYCIECKEEAEFAIDPTKRHRTRPGRLSLPQKIHKTAICKNCRHEIGSHKLEGTQGSKHGSDTQGFCVECGEKGVCGSRALRFKRLS